MAQAKQDGDPGTHAAACRSQDKYFLILKERKVLENDIQTEIKREAEGTPLNVRFSLHRPRYGDCYRLCWLIP